MFILIKVMHISGFLFGSVHDKSLQKNQLKSDIYWRFKPFLKMYKDGFNRGL